MPVAFTFTEAYLELSQISMVELFAKMVNSFFTKASLIIFEKSSILDVKFLDQNGPKMRFFKFYKKSMHETFLILYTKLQQPKGLKLIHIYFLYIHIYISCTGVFGQDRAQNEFL